MLLIGRRHFVTLLGGALADQASLTNAQEPVRVRTVGRLLASQMKPRLATRVFEKGLESEGWSLGQNPRIECRYCRPNLSLLPAEPP